MASASSELAGLVESIVISLVDTPDDVEVSSYEEDGGNVLIEIKVNPDDAGKVIGRQGRVIKSIRTLVRAAATRKDVNVDVELVD